MKEGTLGRRQDLEKIQEESGFGTEYETFMRLKTHVRKGELPYTKKEERAMQWQSQINAHSRLNKARGLHVAFLFASPLILKDKTILKTQVFTNHTPHNLLRQAWIDYYIKECQLQKTFAD